jgi:tetratricopeptide (TPR) repeat protein
MLTQAINRAQAGRNEESLSALSQLAAEHPTEPMVWTARATIRAHLRDIEGAIADWSRAINLRDEEPHYFYMRGIDLFQIGRYEEAVLDFTRVIDLCELHNSAYYREPAHFFRAETFLRLREFRKAKLDCQHVSDDMTTWTDKLRSKADILSECKGD